jgi:hypothetical protein
MVFKHAGGRWPTHEELDFQLSEVERETGLAFDYEGSELEAGGEPAAHYWDEVSGDHGSVQYALDDYFGLAYAAIELDDEEKLEAVFRSLAEKLPVYTVGELSERAAGKSAGFGDLFALALGRGGPFDQELFDLVTRALRHRTIEKRREAAAAAAVLCWPEFEGPLGRALAAEKEETTAGVIAAALRSCGAESVEGAEDSP